MTKHKIQLLCWLIPMGIVGILEVCIAQQRLNDNLTNPEIEMDFEGKLDRYDIETILIEISDRIKRPILLEGVFLEDEKSRLSVASDKKIRALDLLEELCKKMVGFKCQITKNVILIQQDKFIKADNKYPLESKLNLFGIKDTSNDQLVDELMKMRVFTSCYPVLTKEPWHVTREKYNGMKLRDVIVDKLGISGVAWLSLVPDDEKKGFIEQSPVIPELVDDKNLPFYQLRLFVSSKETEKIKDETELTQGTIEVLDGRKYLKMDSVFVEKEYSIILQIENSSDVELFFNNARDNIMIEEAYQDKLSPRGILKVRILYPPENDPQFNDFVLAPKGKKEFTWKLIEGRMKRNYGAVMYEIDDDKRSRIDKVPYEKVTVEVYEYSRPIAYFNDKNGKKYKSNGHEATVRK